MFNSMKQRTPHEGPTLAGDSGRGSAAITLAVAFTVLLLSGCSNQDLAQPAEAHGWVFERSTSGNVTTVRTVAGASLSVAPRLELSLEIGVQEGDERYMLTSPAAFWATDTEIFVLDDAEARVIVFDFQGKFLRSFGRAGPGPYELEDPTGLTVTNEGQVLVSGSSTGVTSKVTAFDLGGEPRDEWLLTAPGERVHLLPDFIRSTPKGLVLGATQYPEGLRQLGTASRYGFATFANHERAADLWLAPRGAKEPATLSLRTAGGATMERPVPFTGARPVTAMGANGDVMWGYPDEYSFKIEHPSGSVTVVQRVTDPTSIDPPEADYYRRLLVRSYRRIDPSFSWDGATIPVTKPWYERIAVDAMNRVWVLRQVGVRDVPGCTSPEDEAAAGAMIACWPPIYELDLFEIDGTYLGAVAWPEELDTQRTVFYGASWVIGYHESRDGTPQVRVYRVVLDPDK